ncbi:MAG: DUF424 domain-containing protein [Candidatus Nanoarchaeia archaeon]
MIVKKHVTGGRLILAVCDSSVAGKKYNEGDAQLDLSSDFYNGEEMPPEEVTRLMKSSFIINLVGEKSLQTAKELVHISKRSVIFIEGIPHAQVLFVPKEG